MDSAPYPDPMTFPYVPVVGTGLQQIQVWNAPFPPPKAVSEYEQMLPGSWDRFLTMAEESQAAQILTMRNAQEYCRCDTKRGHLLGASALFAAMGCAVYCVATRQPLGCCCVSQRDRYGCGKVTHTDRSKCKARERQ
jgi:hypothetical protein